MLKGLLIHTAVEEKAAMLPCHYGPDTSCGASAPKRSQSSDEHVPRLELSSPGAYKI